MNRSSNGDANGDDELIERLRELGAATVHEALGRVGALDPGIRPLDPSVSVAGRAFTVDAAPADNLAVQRAADAAGPGDVIVVDSKGYLDAGAWGDVLTLFAQKRGIVGLVIDGAVRDSRQIIEMGFPVFARGVCIKGTDKVNPGRLGVPVMIGGVSVDPGDVVVGDADGLTVVPASDLGRAVDLAQERDAKEERMRAALSGGASLLDLMGLRGREAHP